MTKNEAIGGAATLKFLRLQQVTIGGSGAFSTVRVIDHGVRFEFETYEELRAWAGTFTRVIKKGL